MYYYCITPLKYYRLTERYKRHLVIAPYLLENEEILEFYRLLITKGADIILDNGVYETGKPMDIEEYFVVIQKLKPTIVVMPDAWKDTQKTVELANEFFEKMHDYHMESNFKIMGVPQGKTLEEYVVCYNKLLPMCEIVGMSVGEWEDATGVIRPFTAMNIDDGFNYIPIHLLGLWNVKELANYVVGEPGQHGKHPRIRSLDTSMPFKLAKQNKSLDNVHLDTSKMDFNMELTEKQQELAIYNLEVLKKMIEND